MTADDIRARHLAWHEDDETLAAWPDRDPDESMEHYIVRADVITLLDANERLSAVGGTLMLRSDHDAVVDRLAQQLRLVTEDRDLMATTVERVRVAVRALHRPAYFEDAPEVAYCAHCQSTSGTGSWDVAPLTSSDSTIPGETTLDRAKEIARTLVRTSTLTGADAREVAEAALAMTRTETTKAAALEEAAQSLRDDETAVPGTAKAYYNAIYATWLSEQAAVLLRGGERP